MHHSSDEHCEALHAEDFNHRSVEQLELGDRSLGACSLPH